MECPVCGCSVHDRPFVRMNPLGEIGVFWCEDCCKEQEPELYRNQKEDEGDVIKFLKDCAYPNRKPQ